MKIRNRKRKYLKKRFNCYSCSYSSNNEDELSFHCKSLHKKKNDLPQSGKAEKMQFCTSKFESNVRIPNSKEHSMRKDKSYCERNVSENVNKPDNVPTYLSKNVIFNPKGGFGRDSKADENRSQSLCLTKDKEFASLEKISLSESHISNCGEKQEIAIRKEKDHILHNLKHEIKEESVYGLSCHVYQPESVQIISTEKQMGSANTTNDNGKYFTLCLPKVENTVKENLSNNQISISENNYLDFNEIVSTDKCRQDSIVYRGDNYVNVVGKWNFGKDELVEIPLSEDMLSKYHDKLRHRALGNYEKSNAQNSGYEQSSQNEPNSPSSTLKKNKDNEAFNNRLNLQTSKIFVNKCFYSDSVNDECQLQHLCLTDLKDENFIHAYHFEGKRAKCADEQQLYKDDEKYNKIYENYLNEDFMHKEDYAYKCSRNIHYISKQMYLGDKDNHNYLEKNNNKNTKRYPCCPSEHYLNRNRIFYESNFHFPKTENSNNNSRSGVNTNDQDNPLTATAHENRNQQANFKNVCRSTEIHNVSSIEPGISAQDIESTSNHTAQNFNWFNQQFTEETFTSNSSDCQHRKKSINSETYHSNYTINNENIITNSLKFPLNDLFHNSTKSFELMPHVSSQLVMDKDNLDLKSQFSNSDLSRSFKVTPEVLIPGSQFQNSNAITLYPIYTSQIHYPNSSKDINPINNTKKGENYSMMTTDDNSGMLQNFHTNERNCIKNTSLNNINSGNEVVNTDFDAKVTESSRTVSLNMLQAHTSFDAKNFLRKKNKTIAYKEDSFIGLEDNSNKDNYENRSEVNSVNLFSQAPMIFYKDTVKESEDISALNHVNVEENIISKSPTENEVFADENTGMDSDLINIIFLQCLFNDDTLDNLDQIDTLLENLPDNLSDNEDERENSVCLDTKLFHSKENSKSDSLKKNNEIRLDTQEHETDFQHSYPEIEQPASVVSDKNDNFITNNTSELPMVKLYDTVRCRNSNGKCIVLPVHKEQCSSKVEQIFNEIDIPFDNDFAKFSDFKKTSFMNACFSKELNNGYWNNFSPELNLDLNILYLNEENDKVPTVFSNKRLVNSSCTFNNSSDMKNIFSKTYMGDLNNIFSAKNNINTERSSIPETALPYFFDSNPKINEPLFTGTINMKIVENTNFVRSVSSLHNTYWSQNENNFKTAIPSNESVSHQIHFKNFQSNSNVISLIPGMVSSQSTTENAICFPDRSEETNLQQLHNISSSLSLVNTFFPYKTVDGGEYCLDKSPSENKRIACEQPAASPLYASQLIKKEKEKLSCDKSLSSHRQKRRHNEINESMSTKHRSVNKITGSKKKLFKNPKSRNSQSSPLDKNNCITANQLNEINVNNLIQELVSSQSVMIDDKVPLNINSEQQNYINNSLLPSAYFNFHQTTTNVGESHSVHMGKSYSLKERPICEKSELNLWNLPELANERNKALDEFVSLFRHRPMKYQNTKHEISNMFENIAAKEYDKQLQNIASSQNKSSSISPSNKFVSKLTSSAISLPATSASPVYKSQLIKVNLSKNIHQHQCSTISSLSTPAQTDDGAFRSEHMKKSLPPDELTVCGESAVNYLTSSQLANERNETWFSNELFSPFSQSYCNSKVNESIKTKYTFTSEIDPLEEDLEVFKNTKFGETLKDDFVISKKRENCCEVPKNLRKRISDRMKKEKSVSQESEDSFSKTTKLDTIHGKDLCDASKQCVSSKKKRSSNKITEVHSESSKGNKHNSNDQLYQNSSMEKEINIIKNKTCNTSTKVNPKDFNSLYDSKVRETNRLNHLKNTEIIEDFSVCIARKKLTEIKQCFIIRKNRNIYVCSICNTEFKYQSHIERHLRKHLKQKEYKCVTCHKGFIGPDGLQRHMKKHKREKGNNSNNSETDHEKASSELLTVIENMLDNDTHQTVNTDLCNKDFTLICEKRFKCPYCDDKSYKFISRLKKHILTHDDKTILGDEMSNYLQETDSGNLINVKNIQTNKSKPEGKNSTFLEETQFNCYYCDKTFQVRSRIDKHILCHTKNNCKKYYVRQRNLRKHAINHNQETYCSISKE